MADDGEMTLIFRCAPELAPILPPPVPAVQGLPDWFKAMPQRAFNAIAHEDDDTVKRCPPFIDAMTYGFLIPLACDLKVANGEFTWDFDLPANSLSNAMRSPISFHDPSQVAGTPLAGDGRFIVKFNNFWTVEAPAGYSLLFTHPANRSDLPFTAITGLVDADLYHDNLVHFPAYWHDANFSGVLPKGTPIVQVMPVKRESWAAQIENLSAEQTGRLHELSARIEREGDVYRHHFRAGKR